MGGWGGGGGTCQGKKGKDYRMKGLNRMKCG